MKWGSRKGKENKCNQWSNPESPKKIPYKILYIIPVTATNAESVAQENSLRNVNWKTLFPTPQLLMGWRDRGVLLIITPYYKEREQWPGTFETANNPTSTWTSSPRSPFASTKNGNIGPPENSATPKHGNYKQLSKTTRKLGDRSKYGLYARVLRAQLYAWETKLAYASVRKFPQWSLKSLMMPYMCASAVEFASQMNWVPWLPTWTCFDVDPSIHVDEGFVVRLWTIHTSPLEVCSTIPNSQVGLRALWPQLLYLIRRD